MARARSGKTIARGAPGSLVAAVAELSAAAALAGMRSSASAARPVIGGAPGVSGVSGVSGSSSGQKLLVSVEEAAWRLSIGKTTLYELFAAGVIRSVQIKRSRLVPVAELEAYVRALLAA